MTRTAAFERIVVPNRPMRAVAAEAARDLSVALDRIRSWTGSSSLPDSRPLEALTVLSRIAETGALALAPDAAARTVKALELAMDLTAIAESLPTERVADLRKDLATCLAGPLIPADGARQSVQAQSQLIVRAALSRGGVVPSQPTHSGSGGRKKPDITIEEGVSTYALEVKRPTALKNALPRALDAVAQLLASGFRGGILVDITDALTSSDAAQADAEVEATATLITNTMFEHGRGWKAGYSHVMLVGVFARPTWLIRQTGAFSAEVNIQSTSCVAALGTAEGTLDSRRAHWLRGVLHKGLNRLGVTTQEPPPGAVRPA